MSSYVAHESEPQQPRNKTNFGQNNLLGIRNGQVFFVCVVSNLHLYTEVHMGLVGGATVRMVSVVRKPFCGA